MTTPPSTRQAVTQLLGEWSNGDGGALGKLFLDEALERLAAQDARKSQIVELRYFGGLTVEETAEFLKLSWRTVEREWTAAKAWLYRELSQKET